MRRSVILSFLRCRTRFLWSWPRSVRRCAGLEAYRDKLIVFCRNVSADPETARSIAAATGLSHTTVLRTGTVAELAGVVAVAQPVAEAMLGWLDPGREPGLYRRLRQIRATSITE